MPSANGLGSNVGDNTNIGGGKGIGFVPSATTDVCGLSGDETTANYEKLLKWVGERTKKLTRKLAHSILQKLFRFEYLNVVTQWTQV